MNRRKKNDTEPSENPSCIDAVLQELEENGYVVLSAATPEELAQQIDELPVQVTYRAGAVGRSQDGHFTLRIDLF